MRIFSNLNLNGSTPPRVQPLLGEWGPSKVPTTKQKKRMRIWVGLVLLAAMIAIFLLGWYVYYLMTGSWGFGIGDDESFFAGGSRYRDRRRSAQGRSPGSSCQLQPVVATVAAASGPWSSSTAKASAPDRIGTFSSTALSYFEPGESPTTTKEVFLRHRARPPCRRGR